MKRIACLVVGFALLVSGIESMQDTRRVVAGGPAGAGDGGNPGLRRAGAGRRRLVATFRIRLPQRYLFAAGRR